MEPVLCRCGCGLPAPIATRTDKSRGTVKGQALTWIRGHDKRKHPIGSTCAVDGCDRTPESRELCHSHFEWSRRNGGARPTSAYLETPLERFEAKYIKAPSGHWIWTGARASRNQYGTFVFDGRTQPAHRVSWMLYRGEIPDSTELDHLCRVTLCVNPGHLEPVAPRVNWERGTAPSVTNARKERCIAGHPLEGDNLVRRSDGGRDCRECRRRRTREAVARWRARQRAAGEASDL